MDAFTIARTRAEHSDHPVAFLNAYTTACRADLRGLDVEAQLADAARHQQWARYAGLIEGIAAVHAAQGMPLHAVPQWRYPRTARGVFAPAAAPSQVAG